jgi:hypothetical protein
MTARILTVLSVALITMPAKNACAATDALNGGGTITSVECSFVRKQWFQGQCRNAQGKFYFDSRCRSACYDYGGPPRRYRFIVNDTAVFGIDAKSNAGYVLTRGADAAQYDELCLSVHLFGQFLRCSAEAADRPSDSIRGSVDSCVYLTKKTDNGSDNIAISRESGQPLLIESFDENGAMVEQSRMAYGDRKHPCAMPKRLIVRMKRGDVVTVDTATLSAIVINSAIAPERFTVPTSCRLCAFHEMRSAPFPFTDKRK